MSGGVMHLKHWTFVGVFIAALPWLAVEVIVALSGYGPMSWGLLRPGISEPMKHSIIYSQWLFDALAFSVPAGGLLAWCSPGRPILLALTAMAGYSLAFFVWGLVTSKDIVGIAVSYISPNHLLLILVFGASTFVFRNAIQKNEPRTA